MSDQGYDNTCMHCLRYLDECRCVYDVSAGPRTESNKAKVKQLSIQLTVPVNEITINMRQFSIPKAPIKTIWIAAAYYNEPGTDERRRYKDAEGTSPEDALDQLMQHMGMS